MIHRFVDLPSSVRCLGLPYVVSLFTDGMFIYKCANQIVSGSEPEFEAASNPILSPDGTKVAYDINFPGPNNEGQIRSQPVGGGAYTILSPNDATGPYMMHPYWGPNSDRVVYVHATNPSGGFNGDIVEVLLSSPTSETTLYSSPDSTKYGAFRPTYNSDGSKIAFFLSGDSTSAVNSTAGLYVMDSDGTNVTQLDTWADTNGDNYAQDGSQLCWDNNDVIYYGRYSFTGGPDPQTIYKINVDGTGMTEISNVGDTTGKRCRITNRALPDDQSFLIISADTSGAGDWFPCRLELDGSDSTQLNASHGPDGRQYFRSCYVHPQDQRIWFIEHALETNSLISSMALDGTDYRLEQNISSITGQAFTPVFSSGDGIEWN